jgi:hypothetical protein
MNIEMDGVSPGTDGILPSVNTARNMRALPKRSENYHEKWEYVRQNPVRKGFVPSPDDWPYQGILNELRW